MKSPTWTVRSVPYDAPEAQTLVGELMADLGRRYGGPGDATPLSPHEFEPPLGTFLVMADERGLIGCAGIRQHGADAELKRMYVREERRGQGYGVQLLAAVEEYVRSHGISRVILETGILQPEAINLYTSHGYSPIPGFGYYKDEPESRCFAKWL